MSGMLSSKGFSYFSLFLGLWFVMASPDISPTAFCSIFGFEMLVLFSSSHVTVSFWCKALCDCIYTLSIFHVLTLIKCTLMLAILPIVLLTVLTIIYRLHLEQVETVPTFPKLDQMVICQNITWRHKMLCP